ncbi:type II toxin-antitoxin system HicB family antitoxin, partial [Acinetobacter guerrae]
MEVSVLYPVYVHKDQDSAYGLTFPDLEGCFSAADDMQDIQHM